MTRRRVLIALLAAALLTACQNPKLPPVATADYVDLQRFMGDWYVIAAIPTFIETDAYNAVESYRLNDDGSIATTFTFNEGGFDGELKRYTPTGYVRDSASNAVWGMQFVWPVKADYRIMYLAPDYSLTVIGRNQRDYVWIMAREPTLADDRYREMVRFIETQGYDAGELRRVPHRPQAGPTASRPTAS